jgi:ABC-2 type transport system ATP-binding protein
VIHTEALTRSFGRGPHAVEAVRGIDLDVGAGELVALLGPNGAGKSTTLRMLTSLLPPTSGRARVAGLDVTVDPAAVRARIGYIGQKDGAGHNYRVWDELRLQGRFYGLDSRTAADRGAELLHSLDLAGLRMRKVSTLSGGQKRRLDIALGLIHGPELLFLDEPSTGMDPQNRANLWEHIARLRGERGTTIVLTTHYLEEADSMAERVVVIDHGRIIADDAPAVLKADLAGDRITVLVAPGDADTARAVAGRFGSDLQERTSDPGVELSFRVDVGPPTLPVVLAELAAHGVQVRAATLRQPTLDDVFLTLTGRSLREGAEA